MSTVRICLRGQRWVDVDLDALTPRARALAEVVAAGSGYRQELILRHATHTLRDTLDPEHADLWYTPAKLDAPHEIPWLHWSRYLERYDLDEHVYLEQQVAEMPIGYYPVRPAKGKDTPDVPAASDAVDDTRYLTRDQVLAVLRAEGRPISVSTWAAYTHRGQCPPPARYIGRTPQWDHDQVVAFARHQWTPTTAGEEDTTDAPA